MSGKHGGQCSGPFSLHLPPAFSGTELTKSEENRENKEIERRSNLKIPRGQQDNQENKEIQWQADTG